MIADVKPAAKPLNPVSAKISGKSMGADEHTMSTTKKRTFSKIPKRINDQTDISVSKVVFTYALISKKPSLPSLKAHTLPQMQAESHIMRVI